MANRKKLIQSKIGKPPGTLTYLGDHSEKDIKITFLEYDEENYNLVKKISLAKLKELLAAERGNKIRWINICGLNDVDIVSQIGDMFSINKLVLEDIVNVYHRPKLEVIKNILFAVLKKISIQDNKVKLDPLNIIVTPDTLLTFQDHNEETFELIYERINLGKGVFRKSGRDYLLYVLIDFMVDKYFFIMEDLNERIEAMQEKLMESPEKEDLKSIQNLKQDVQKARNSLHPMREAVNSLIRNDSNFVTHDSIIYLRDTYDHIVHLIEMIESARESILALMDIYLSRISNKMNEVMKVLTIIATIFIPLTFIAGVYGMNFETMPELHWEYGYPVIWSIMILAGIILIAFFKKKHWF